MALAVCLVSSFATRAAGEPPDIPAAVARVPSEAAPLVFERGNFELPGGGHLQGVQLHFDAANERYLAFLSHDSTTVAYLLVVEFPADLSVAGRLIHVHKFPSDGASPPLRHAGGMQLAGEVLAVGLEDNQQKTRSEIQFWNVADPRHPAQLKHLTIRRAGKPKDQTAGAVGIVRRAHDHLLAVANWDSRAIDFYRTPDKPLADPACRFEFLARWQDTGADKSDWQPDRICGRYQAINLLADRDRKVFLAGFPTAAAEVVELFRIDIGQPSAKLLRKLARKQMRLPPGNGFQFAGGIVMLRDRAAILSSPAAIGAQTTLGIAR